MPRGYDDDRSFVRTGRGEVVLKRPDGTAKQTANNIRSALANGVASETRATIEIDADTTKPKIPIAIIHARDAVDDALVVLARPLLRERRSLGHNLRSPRRISSTSVSCLRRALTASL